MPKHGIFYHRFNQRQKIHKFICFIIFVIGCPVLIKSSHSDFTVTQTDSDTQSHSHTSDKISSTSCGHQNPVVSQVSSLLFLSQFVIKIEVVKVNQNDSQFQYQSLFSIFSVFVQSRVKFNDCVIL